MSPGMNSSRRFEYQRLRALFSADMILLLLLGVTIGLAFGAQALLHQRLTPFWLFWAGVALSLIPALVWLIWFYRRDHLNPEPKNLILEVFILGGLTAAAVAIPLLNTVFQVDSWLSRDWPWSYLLGSFLVVGFTQESLKYAVVRFSVFQSPAFNELTDGVIYATVAGLGFATVLNIQFVNASGGTDLGLTAVWVVVNALGQASFAGVMGYFLGRERFMSRPLWWMPLGVTLAAALNALFFTLRTALTRGGFTSEGGAANAWVGVVLAALLAVGVASALMRLLRRDVGVVFGTATPEEAA